ncbi:MAG: DNA mismatch repair protein MutH [Ruminococcaceae bacterium]|jgi:DNA mismatch repair protein MutH|nr:DNA mismatch repair protein MutH [Oscillospiraceae bacterium]
MKLKEAQKKIIDICNIPFSDLFDEDDFALIKKNKGKTGQLLELALGKKLSNANLDFEDGELKTNKCDASGNPKETVFITQISCVIDELIDEKPFEETHLYEKINNILYVPVCKEGDPHNWMFLDAIHIDLTKPEFAPLLDTWRNDYYSICKQLKTHIENSPDGFIHTSNGTHIQVRSKDSKPYHPIYSKHYKRNISNKNHAFYFQKQFVYDVRKVYGEK